MKHLTNYCDFINEVKIEHKNMYFHGCSSTELGEKIIKDGFLKPGNENVKRGSKLTPMLGKVYMTAKLELAITYVTGMCMLGQDISKQIRNGQFGYLFVIDNDSLSDVDPDEDALGELIYLIYNKQNGGEFDVDLSSWSERQKQDLLGIAKRCLTPIQFNKVISHNDYGDFAVAGKNLNKNLPPYIKVDVINLNIPIANQGMVNYKEAWKFDKLLNVELKKDASNFFELAEKIK